jgi:hypothetical protein
MKDDEQNIMKDDEQNEVAEFLSEIHSEQLDYRDEIYDKWVEDWEKGKTFY